MESMEEEIKSVERNYKDILRPNQMTRNDIQLSRYRMKFVLVLSGALVLFGETIGSAVMRWHELSRRFLAIEDVNIWIVILAGIYHFYFLTHERQTILQIITDSSEKQFHWLAGNPQMELLLKRFKKKARMDIKYIKVVLIAILLNYITLPMFLTIYKIVMLQISDVMQLNLPFEFYNLDITTTKYNLQVPFFVVVNFLQIVFVKIIVDISKYMFISFAGPVNKIVLDIKLLCIAINELDSQIQLKEKLTPKGLHQFDEIILRRYVRHTVQQHINICRNVAGLNRSIRVLAFYTIPSICLQLCLLFYWILEVDVSWVHQLVDGSQVMAVCGYAYLYSSVGQNIINEDEALRRTLLECSWLEKPTWFQKTLLLMLTRTSRQLSISPYRLFIIDYVHFTSMMNAAYSYYNFLRTTKN